MKKEKKGNERRGRTLLISDLREGIICKLPIYFFIAVFAGVLCGAADRELTPLLVEKTNSVKGATMGDYLMILFKGIDPPVPNETFKVPVLWIGLFLIPLVLHAAYPAWDWERHAKIVVLYHGRRRSWWNAKAVWCLVAAAATELAFLFGTFLFSVIKGAKGILPHGYVYSSVFYLNPEPALAELFSCMLMLILTLCFIFFTLYITELFFSVFISPIAAVGACIIYLILSAFYQNPLLLGNYVMMCRLKQAVEGGVAAEYGLLFAVGIAAIFMLLGNRLIRKREIY